MTDYTVFNLTNDLIPGVEIVSYSTKGYSGVRATLKQYLTQYRIYSQKKAQGEKPFECDFYRLFNDESSLKNIIIEQIAVCKNLEEVDKIKKERSKKKTLEAIPEQNVGGVGWKEVSTFLTSEMERVDNERKANHLELEKIKKIYLDIQHKIDRLNEKYNALENVAKSLELSQAQLY